MSDGTIARTPNLDCPACQVKRLHVKAEWSAFHPLAGTGRIHDVAVGKPKATKCP